MKHSNFPELRPQLEGIDDQTWLKGELLHSKSAWREVTAIERHEAYTIRLTGKVKGTLSSPYKQVVELTPSSASGLWQVDGHCSCPVGWNCKHVAALILFARSSILHEMLAVKEEGGLVTPAARIPWEVTQWVDRLKFDLQKERTALEHASRMKRLSASSSGHISYQGLRLIYLVSVLDGKLSIELAKGRLNKSGWSDKYETLSKSAADFIREPPKYVNLEDDLPTLKALHLLSLNDYFGDRLIYLKGDEALSAINLVQQTGRVAIRLDAPGTFRFARFEVANETVSLVASWQSVESELQSGLRYGSQALMRGRQAQPSQLPDIGLKLVLNARISLQDSDTLSSRKIAESSLEGGELVFIDKPYWMPRNTLTLFPVDSTLSESQLKLIPRMPLIPESVAQELAQSLDQLLPESLVLSLRDYKQQNSVLSASPLFRVRLARFKNVDNQSFSSRGVPQSFPYPDSRVAVLEVRYGQSPWLSASPLVLPRLISFTENAVFKRAERDCAAEFEILKRFSVFTETLSVLLIQNALRQSGSAIDLIDLSSDVDYNADTLELELCLQSCRCPLVEEDWPEALQKIELFCKEESIEFVRDQDADLRIYSIQSFEIELTHPTENWLEAAFTLRFDDREVDLGLLLSQVLENRELLELALSARQSEPLVLALDEEQNEFIRIPIQNLSPLVDLLRKLLSSPKPSLSIPFFELGHFQALTENVDLTSPTGLTNELETQAPVNVKVTADTDLYRLVHNFEEIIRTHEVELSPKLQARLRPYQREGVAWLQLLTRLGFNGLLADDMGLGKTLQTIAVLTWASDSNLSNRSEVNGTKRRLGSVVHLVVVPNSLISNWVKETKKFAPSFRVATFETGMDVPTEDFLGNIDLLICPYSMLTRHIEALSTIQWGWIVADESQRIKNANTQTARALKRLTSANRLALSGTPIENHLGELWSQMDFLMPGFLGTRLQFNERWRNPIEKLGLTDVSKSLSSRLKPFMRRRTKSQVAAELPDKTEQIIEVSLNEKQAQLYETVRASMDKRVAASLREAGFARSQILFLEALLRLRQICCDPRLVDAPAPSAKFETLIDLLQTLTSEGRRVLVFSQFSQMLDLIEKELCALEINTLKLTGKTKGKIREDLITQFETGDFSVFLISLKAGGVGLNLVSADTVIIFDPWWNPAAEQQAIDRAHRIGQSKKVNVYRLIALGTVEEKVLSLHDKKQALVEQVMLGQELDTGLSEEDFKFLLGK